MTSRLHVLDSHTEGEPTRLVLDGFPDPGPGTLAAQRAILATRHDHWRRATLLEPRGHDVLVGALLRPPEHEGSTAGVIFFNNTGWLGMCGHGTIGLMASLAHLGRIQPGAHAIDTPVGTVQATLHEDGRVSVRNVPAWRHRRDVALHVPGWGEVRGDVAWGGNWFFLVRAPQMRVAPSDIPTLTAFTLAVQSALAAQQITGAEGAVIDHVECFEDAAPQADSRNFVMCPGGAYDRSPCGTGTSAKLACLAADGLLAPGQPWRQQSVIGSHFDASYVRDDSGRLIPTITGRAWITAETTLVLDPTDPYVWGIG